MARPMTDFGSWSHDSSKPEKVPFPSQLFWLCGHVPSAILLLPFLTHFVSHGASVSLSKLAVGYIPSKPLALIGELFTHFKFSKSQHFCCFWFYPVAKICPVPPLAMISLPLFLIFIQFPSFLYPSLMVNCRLVLGRGTAATCFMSLSLPERLPVFAQRLHDSAKWLPRLLTSGGPQCSFSAPNVFVLILYLQFCTFFG